MSAPKRGVPDRKARRIVERAWTKAAAKWLGFSQPGKCFANAQALVLNDSTGEINYHEGYCICSCGLPGHYDDVRLPHAFCSIDGVVVDPTVIPHDHRAYEIAYTLSNETIRGVRRSRERVGRTDLMIGDLKGIFQKDGKEYVR